MPHDEEIGFDLSELAGDPSGTIARRLGAMDPEGRMTASLARPTETDAPLDFFWELDLSKLGSRGEAEPSAFLHDFAALLRSALSNGIVEEIATLGDGTIVALGDASQQDPSPRAANGGNAADRWRIFLTGQVAVGMLRHASNGAATEEWAETISKRWEPVLRQAGVVPADLWRLQVAPSVWPQLESSVPDIVATPADLPDDGELLDGSGTIVGVVDFGCDFTHPNFRSADGDTRLLYLWDQNEGSAAAASGPFGYGREFDGPAIDAAIGRAEAPDFVTKGDAPFWALGYDPHDNYYADLVGMGAHGTHVLDIAAGNGRATHLTTPHGPGVAPNAEIVFVQVKKPLSIAGRKLLSFVQVVRGVQYIFYRAQQLGRPAVVNISLNTMAGPHDGSSIAERMLDVLANAPGRAIVVAAGNFGNSLLHVNETVRPTGQVDMPWFFPAGDRSRNDLAIWYDGPAVLRLTLTAPKTRGMTPIVVDPGSDRIIHHDGREIGFISNAASTPGSETNVILIGLHPHRARGNGGLDEEWNVGLSFVPNLPAAPPVPDRIDIDAWIDRDDEGQSTFAPRQATSRGTLGTIACGQHTIVVGAYYAAAPAKPVLRGASRGPTRDGRLRPDVSAPGRAVRAALSKGYRPLFSDTDKWRTPATVPKDGTSMAAPHVTGTIALMFQRDASLTGDMIREALIASARRMDSEPPAGPGPWDPSLGFGRVAVADAIRKLP